MSTNRDEIIKQIFESILIENFQENLMKKEEFVENWELLKKPILLKFVTILGSYEGTESEKLL